MRIGSFLKFYILLISFLLIFYTAYPMPSSKSEVFLFLAVSFLSPYIFKEIIKIRGVKKGDLLLISMKTEHPLGLFMQKVPARALSDGRIGDVIEIEFDSRRANGEVINYGGIFFPPEINLLYYEENFLQKEIL